MKPETRREVEEGLRSAQEMLQFLWNGVADDDRPAEDGRIEIKADDATAPTLAALLTDARDRVSNALEALEMDP